MIPILVIYSKIRQISHGFALDITEVKRNYVIVLLVMRVNPAKTRWNARANNVDMSRTHTLIVRYRYLNIMNYKI